MSCMLVSSAVGKQHRQRQAKSVSSFFFAKRTIERGVFVMGVGHGSLEERCCGMQPPVCSFKTSSAPIFLDLIRPHQ